MKDLIRKILKESLESKWNLGNEWGNNNFCNVGIVKKDIERFLSHPEVKGLLKLK